MRAAVSESERRAAGMASSPVMWMDAAVFLIGLGSFYHIFFVGEVYPSEIALFVLLFMIFGAKHRYLSRQPVPMLIAVFAIWLLGQVGTDLIRHTPIRDMMRGWAAIIVFFIDFIVVYMLVSEQVRRVYFLIFGYALGWLIAPLIQPSPSFSAEPWKFGFGVPFILMTFAYLGWRHGRALYRLRKYTVLLIFLGLISIFLNARSLGAYTILSSLLIWLRGSRVGERFRWKVSLRRLLFLIALVFITAFGVKQLYGYMADHGLLGEHARMKYEMQATGKLGLLIGGRAELIPAVFAVMDSPIIGHGSWAKDPKYREYLLLLLELGYQQSEEQLERGIESSDLIPHHSHILQNWVWAGILGALFWAFVLFWVVRIAWHSFRQPNELFAPLVFLSLLSIWDVFFSPLGSMTRFVWAVKLTVLLVSWRLVRQEQRAARSLRTRWGGA
ncbi:MAG: hypothetical protein D6690_07910 [Nitrospirae bacterium]|nr:MAG: hypothetical protein D6690_07910 [Nitrospirota bacterium]